MLSKPSWVHHLLRHPKNTKGTKVTQQGLNFKNVKFKEIILIKKNSYHEECVYTDPPG